MEDYRAEALLKLVNNNVSAANMEVWIAGYIAGREEGDKKVLSKYEDEECVPYNELWMKNSDGIVTKIINIGG
jgi:hypothetical protein